MQPDTPASNHSDIMGHPRGLFYLFFAELWERFSFYGMRALLTLYMVNEIFEALANKDTATAIVYASYGSLVYASTVIGGRVADRLIGYRYSILLGGILMAVGHFVLAIPNDITFFLALAFIIVGNGFFKPNISTFVGTLYPQNDIRKDSGFTIFYMGINIGAWLSPLLCGWLARAYGWHYGFGLAGVGMLAGLIFFWSGIQKGVFMDKGLPPFPDLLEKKWMGLTQKVWVPLLAVLSVPLIAFLVSSYEYIGGGNTFLGEKTLVNVLFNALGVILLAYIAFIMTTVTRAEALKLLVAVLLTLFMTLFWGFHELSGSVLTLFADRNVDLQFIDAAQSNAINPFFIIILSIPFSMLWVYLSRHKLNPRTPFKFAMGLACLGLGFYILYLSKNFANAEGQVPFSFLIVMYMFISAGELLMSPVGLSKITDLSPIKVVAFMMGVWFLSSAYAFRIVEVVGKQLAIDKISGDGRAIDATATLDLYTQGFESIAYVSLGGAILVLLLSPLMLRWMADIR